MSANPAYQSKFKVSTDGSTWYDVAFANSASEQRMLDLLETTNFKDAASAAEKTRIAGLGDGSYDIECDYDNSDTNGQNAIRSAAYTRSALYVKYLPDGTHGTSAQVLVENLSTKSAIGALATFTASMKKTGAVTVI